MKERIVEFKDTCDDFMEISLAHHPNPVIEFLGNHLEYEFTPKVARKIANTIIEMCDEAERLGVE